MHQKLIEVIDKYIDDDVNNIILKKKNKEFKELSNDDFNFVVTQIACRQKYNNKFPIVLQNKQFTFLDSLSAEQASSELAAFYKSNIVENYQASIDLTGGLGIDSIYFAKKSEKHTYCESNLELYNAFIHNYRVLCVRGIKYVNFSVESFISNLDRRYNVLYIDPSRRDSNNSKVFLLEELFPNVLLLQKYFSKIANKAIIKLSPMFDISAAIDKIENVSEVHIVSIDNDCKELLLVCDYRNFTNKIIFVGVNFICDYKNITNDIRSIIKRTQRFEYILSNSNSVKCSNVKKFIFEPNSSIMKLACWSELCGQFNLYKLHPNSNLFTSDIIKKKFPGFIYEIVDVVSYSRNNVLNVIGDKSKVSIKCRNFPNSVDNVMRTLKLKDGNDYYLFCTTLIDNKPKVIITNKVELK
jgi:hypothetical protein